MSGGPPPWPPQANFPDARSWCRAVIRCHGMQVTRHFDVMLHHRVRIYVELLAPAMTELWWLRKRERAFGLVRPTVRGYEIYELDVAGTMMRAVLADGGLSLHSLHVIDGLGPTEFL